MPIFSSKQNQNLYLNGQFISGVQSIRSSSSTNINPSIAINDSGLNYLVTDQNKATLNIEYIPSNYDFIVNFTGLNPVSGKIVYANKYFDFNSGYLSSYNIRSSLDNPVSCRADLEIYGRFAEQAGTLNVSPVDYTIDPYDICYTNITFNEAQTNRLSSFDMTITCSRIPQYNIGEYYPTEVLINYPLKIDFNFDLDIENYTVPNIRSFLTNREIRSILLDFKKYSDDTTIFSFNFNNLILNEPSVSLDVNNLGRASVSFSTYLLN